MARMPKVGPDPFSYADQYNRNMTVLGGRNEQNAQNALETVFAAEASRQRPWSDLPVDLAKTNNQYRNARNNAAASARYKDSRPVPVGEVSKMVYDTAKALGYDPIEALALVDVETGGSFNPRADNPKSSAYGLGQQIDNNWAQYGQGMDRNNPEHQVRAMIAYAKDVKDAIRSVGIEPTPGLTYVGYQQGPGAIKAMLANPNASVYSILGVEEARLNGARRGETAASFVNRWSSEMEHRYARHKKVRTRKREEADSSQLMLGNEVFNLVDPVNRENDDNAAS